MVSCKGFVWMVSLNLKEECFTHVSIYCFTNYFKGKKYFKKSELFSGNGNFRNFTPLGSKTFKFNYVFKEVANIYYYGF